MTTTKLCPDCGQWLEKNLENFYPSKSTWGGMVYQSFSTRCRPCHRKFNRDAKHRAVIRARIKPRHTGPIAGTVERIFFCQIRGHRV